eukprot:764506-Hanusia_phi.AAC.7
MPEEEMMQEKDESRCVACVASVPSSSDAGGCSCPSQGCEPSVELAKRERMKELRTVFELSADYYELVDGRRGSVDVIC